MKFGSLNTFENIRPANSQVLFVRDWVIHLMDAALLPAYSCNRGGQPRQP